MRTPEDQLITRETTEKLKKKIKDWNVRFQPKINKSGLVKGVLSEAEVMTGCKSIWKQENLKVPKGRNIS